MEKERKTVVPVPMVNDIAFDTLMADPYPSFDQVRKMASAVWVESARINLVTRFNDIMHIERNCADFSSANPGSLMNKVMGHSLMRKDGASHKAERNAVEPAFKADVVKEYWVPKLHTIADRLITEFEGQGEADLFDAFAAPFSAFALTAILGFHEDVSWQNMCIWSQSLMDGVGNYGGDPEIAKRGEAAGTAIAVEIDRMLEKHREIQNPTVLSSMVNAASPHSIEQIRANINVIVGGGLNEPRDSILTMIFGLLSHPEQLATVKADPSKYSVAFEEAVRWVSPIGMYPRRVTRDIVLGDTQLKEGDQLGLCVGAANRDPTRFECPHQFNINRKRKQHLGFGAGPHFCAGTWVARQMVGSIAVPMIFSRLKNLRLHPQKPVIQKGWVFRGPIQLPVQWDV